MEPVLEPVMEPSAYLAAIVRDSAAFVESARIAGLDAPVPSCPGWVMADLIWHVAEVHYFWASVVQQRATGWSDVARIERVADDQLFGAYDEHSVRLLKVLRETDPTTTVWTWSAQHDVLFIVRRMAQETAVHRWDADAAAGRSVPLDALLASDGIDEFLTHFLDDIVPDAPPLGGSVHLHCTDVAGEWTVRPNPMDGDDRALGFEVTREHAKGDCALRGPASDLLLALWRRTNADSIDIIGDQGVASRFLASTNLN
jgi:uncharacterized protein (TIGR03083 family)